MKAARIASLLEDASVTHGIVMACVNGLLAGVCIYGTYDSMDPRALNIVYGLWVVSLGIVDALRFKNRLLIRELDRLQQRRDCELMPLRVCYVLWDEQEMEVFAKLCEQLKLSYWASMSYNLTGESNFKYLKKRLKIKEMSKKGDLLHNLSQKELLMFITETTHDTIVEHITSLTEEEILTSGFPQSIKQIWKNK